MKKIALLALVICFVKPQAASSQQPQNRPEFCQIYNGNVSRYVSQYDMINHGAATPYRPFISNTRPYKIKNDLAAQPLFYGEGSLIPNSVTASTDPVIAVFELKGKYGNLSIDNTKIVTQVLEYWSTSSSFELLGFCINGTYVPNRDRNLYSIYDKRVIIPQQTINALNEASTGIQADRIGGMIK